MNENTYAEEKTSGELLGELIVHQQKESRHVRITSFANILLILALIAAMVIIVPRAVHLMDHMESTLDKGDAMVTAANGLIAKADGLVETANGLIAEADSLAAGAHELIDNTNDMVERNIDAVTETVQKLNQVDFDALNQAIRDLANVIHPLSEFVSIFER